MPRTIKTDTLGTIERPRGWGGYRRLGPATYEIYFQHGDTRRTEYAETEEQAVARLDEVYERRSSGQTKHLLGYPFPQLAREWKADKARPVHGILRATICGYGDIIDNHLLPVFGDSYVHEIIAAVVDAYATVKLRGAVDDNGDPYPAPPVAGNAQAQVSPSTLDNQLDVFSQIMGFAAKRGLIDRNPVDDVTRPKRKRKRVKAYETADALEILSYVDDPDARMVIELLLFIGLRFGEALALYISDFRRIKLAGTDQETIVLTIERVLRRLGDGGTGLQIGGKTDNAERALPISLGLWQRVESYIAETDERPDPTGDGLLLRTSTGQPLSQSNLRNRHWLPAVGAFEVKRLRPAKLKRLLLAIDPRLRLPVRLLAALPLCTLTELRHLRRDAFDPQVRTVTYTDCHGTLSVVELEAELAGTVASHLEETDGAVCKRNLMFAVKKGLPIGREHFVKDVFRDGFKAAGINPMTRVHNLRHTWVTTQIELGTDDSALAYRAGHSSPAFTRSQYGHIRERVRLQVADTYAVLMGESEAATA